MIQFEAMPETKWLTNQINKRADLAHMTKAAIARQIMQRIPTITQSAMDSWLKNRRNPNKFVRPMIVQVLDNLEAQQRHIAKKSPLGRNLKLGGRFS